MKHIKYLLLFCLIFFLLECTNNITILNIITNDILLYEIIDSFNLSNPNIKIRLDYINDSSKNIFDFVQRNNIRNYDIIAGFYLPDVIIDSKNYTKINISIKDDDIFEHIKENYINNNCYYLLYSIDFPIIIARKDRTKNLNNNQITIEDFIKLVRTNNIKKNSILETKISFSPLLSNFYEFQYYTVFNCSLQYKNNKFYFDNQNFKEAFNFYYKFDNNYNYGIELTKKYIDKYKNIDKKFFLDKEIIYFDFKNFSESFNFDRDTYNKYLIKNMNYPSFHNKAIAISNKTLFKKECLSFIEYLLEKNNQQRMMKFSLNSNFEPKHIAIYKELLYEEFKNSELIDYINNLKDFKFYNTKIQKNFFEAFKNSKDFFNNTDISDEQFISYFLNKINK